MNMLTVSPSPHIRDNMSVRKIMWTVVIALLPAFAVSVWYFGISALLIVLLSVGSCVTFEFLIQKLFFKEQTPSWTDGSAVITGLLLAFNVPSNLPVWMMMLGALFAIGIAKMSYGGLGKNPFNPALAARVFLLISFPVEMTSWPLPLQNRMVLTDAVTGPTPLGMVREGMTNGQTLGELMEKVPSHLDMLLGNMGGSLGEVSALAIIIGGLFLLIRRIISWHIPVSFLLTVFIFTAILHEQNAMIYADPIFHILSGGVMLGAFFMATDMVTSPMTKGGMLLFGLGCGLLTVVIRVWGIYPEGVSFAILIMNALTPLINKGFRPKRFAPEKTKES
ncbi:MAG: RnfABCDGE type electron transport complex subunit D [Bacteroidota bacterium]